jgi:hypothetical protein
VSHLFERTRTSYAVAIEEAAFLDLIDSESYVTGNAAFDVGNETLSTKLETLPGISGVDYSGHYGAFVYLTIDADVDKPKLHERASKLIDRHLAWCAKLTKAPHIVERRKAA